MSITWHHMTYLLPNPGLWTPLFWQFHFTISNSGAHTWIILNGSNMKSNTRMFSPKLNWPTALVFLPVKYSRCVCAPCDRLDEVLCYPPCPVCWHTADLLWVAMRQSRICLSWPLCVGPSAHHEGRWDGWYLEGGDEEWCEEGMRVVRRCEFINTSISRKMTATHQYQLWWLCACHLWADPYSHNTTHLCEAQCWWQSKLASVSHPPPPR